MSEERGEYMIIDGSMSVSALNVTEVTIPGAGPILPPGTSGREYINLVDDGALIGMAGMDAMTQRLHAELTAENERLRERIAELAAALQASEAERQGLLARLGETGEADDFEGA